MEIYYLLLDKDTGGVSIAWKAFHVIMLVFIIISGFITAFLFGHGLEGFGNHCVLYAQIVFVQPSNTTTVAPAKITSLKNVVIPEGYKPLDLSLTNWNSMRLCYFCQFMPLVSMISALFWITLFMVCSRGGSGYVTDTYTRPWRIVYPALVYSVSATISMLVSSSELFSGLEAFCSEFKEVFHTGSCVEEIDFYTTYFHTHSVNSVKLLYYSSLCSWFCCVFWLLHSVILFIRILCVPDFRMVRVLVTPKNDPEEGLPIKKKITKFTPGPSTCIPYLKPCTKNKQLKKELSIIKEISQTSGLRLDQTRRSQSETHLKQRYVKKTTSEITSNLNRSRTKMDDHAQKFTYKLKNDMWYSIYSEDSKHPQKQLIKFDSSKTQKYVKQYNFPATSNSKKFSKPAAQISNTDKTNRTQLAPKHKSDTAVNILKKNTISSVQQPRVPLKPGLKLLKNTNSETKLSTQKPVSTSRSELSEGTSIIFPSSSNSAPTSERTGNKNNFYLKSESQVRTIQSAPELSSTETNPQELQTDLDNGTTLGQINEESTDIPDKDFEKNFPIQKGSKK